MRSATSLALLTLAIAIAIAVASVLLPRSGDAARRSTVRGAMVELSPFHDNAHNAIVRVVTPGPEVALTFDDGPDPRWTPRFLRLLRAHNSHATFFLIGRKALRNRRLVHRELRYGEETGNHTFGHPRLTDLPSRRIGGEIAGGTRALIRSGAPRPTLFRPPFGAFDERVGSAAAVGAELLVGWDLPLDRYFADVGEAAVPQALLADLRPGSIILAHDGASDRPRTLRALRIILTSLDRQGIRVVTVSQLLADAGADRES